MNCQWPAACLVFHFHFILVRIYFCFADAHLARLEGALCSNGSPLADSFVVLSSELPSSQSLSAPVPEAPSASASNMDNQVRLFTKITEIASNRTSVDFPLCQSCADATVSELDRRLREAEEECVAYEACLSQLHAAASANVASDQPASQGDSELGLLQAQEEALTARLVELRAESAAQRLEARRLDRECARMDEVEQLLFDEYHSFTLELGQLSSEHAALQRSVLVAGDRLERLKRVNVYDDAFYISTDGHFGTINGLRLGTLPSSQPVDWNEINAALGHTCLLLATLARRCSFKFTKCGVFPAHSVLGTTAATHESAVHFCLSRIVYLFLNSLVFVRADCIVVSPFSGPTPHPPN